MFLFVSRACFKQTCLKSTAVKNAALLVALLLTSLTAHAEPVDAVEKSVQASQKPASQQQDVQPQHDQTSDNRRQNFNFPHWPQYHQTNTQQTNKEIIPPPPPGPYVSSALSDYSVRAPSFGTDPGIYERHYPAYRYDSASAPMDRFSPDIPWPNNLRPGQPKRSNYWMPENSNYRHYNFGNTYDPRMNGSRWMPSMGVAPRRPYGNVPNYRSNYGPNYRSNNEPYYGRPAINNSDARSAKHPYSQSGNSRYPDRGW